MEITLNGKEYTAPTPVTGLWFAIQKLKTEQEKRVAEIVKMWDEVRPFDGKEDIEAAALNKLEQTMVALTKKTDSNKQILLESKIKIIVDVFKNPEITQETILEYLPLQDVSTEYAKIENWLNDIVIGRTVELPKDQTPTV